jgi:GAF domain-containing protein
MRDPMAKVLGVLAVDEPLRGRRPTDDELGVLMAVADHAGLVLSLAAPEVSRGRVAGSI